MPRQATSRLHKGTKDDPWDGRTTREEAFIQMLKAARQIQNSAILIRSLMRSGVKSPREIAIIREATRIAGSASWKPCATPDPGCSSTIASDAEFVFKKHGAQGRVLCLVATGKNTIYSHLP